MDAVRCVIEDGAFLPERAHDTDAGADIRSPYGFILHARTSQVVRTGVHVETPPNHVTMIKSKSGLNIRSSLTAEGVVDEGYTGEIVVKLYNHGYEPVHIKKGDKIAQLVIMPVVYPSFVQVEEISGGERGDNGFGSTGR